jgi:hypothetical protein
VLIIGAGLYATVFGQISLLIKNLNAQTTPFYEKMDYINTRMELMGLEKPLRKRVSEYYKFMWKRLKTINKFGEGTSFLDSLPYNLRANIAMERHRHVVRKVHFFQDADEAFISGDPE